MEVIKTQVKNIYRKVEGKYLEKVEYGHKNLHTLEKRKRESKNILKMYPDRIPIIVERFGNTLQNIDRKKYLVPNDLSVSNFIYVIRKRLKLNKDVALFIFINKKLFPMNNLIIEIYEKNVDEDGFLYVKYCGENTFG